MPGGPLRILVVEDDLDIQEAIRDTLPDVLGHLGRVEITCAGNGQEALDLLREHARPHLVLLDLMMPVLDGWGFRRAQKQDPRLAAIPVIVMSANTTAYAQAIDAAAVIKKPIDLDVLTREITTALEHQRKGRDAQALVDVVELMRDAFFVVARDWTVMVVNENLARMTGQRREELVGHSLRELYPDLDAGDSPYFVELRRAMSERVHIHLDHYDAKTQKWFDVRAYPVPGGGLAVFVRDVTERRGGELRLQLSDRLISLGTLAAGVAHEINNPMAYLLSNLSIVLRDFDPLARGALEPELRADLKSALEEALEGANRVRAIVADLKSFTGQSQDSGASEEPVTLLPAITFAVRMATPQFKHRARLEETHGPAPKVLINASRMGQVILNLLINAAQAIPEGTPDDQFIRVSSGTTATGWAQVEVRDSGAGIPPEVLARIFDPFFTTKPAGVGTGLGLAVCQSIVVKAGGRIEVESELGKGSAFRVLLPPAPA